MSNSGRRSLVRFLVIYWTSTLLLFALASGIFYFFMKHSLIDRQRDSLFESSLKIQSKIRELHHSFDDVLYYPTSLLVKSALFDKDKNYIFGSLPASQTLEETHNKNMLYLIKKLEPYYLGGAYLLLIKETNFKPITKLRHHIYLFMLGAGVFFLLLGYYLGKLFVAPMRQSLERMNHFIQDTTHELNTPISTILTNIEMIETFGTPKNCLKEIKRIEIASKTLSRIYDDLTYLNLNHHYYQKIVWIDMGFLIKERIEYFKGLIALKSLVLKESIEEDILIKIDKNDAMRLIDNLISNAIKYNKSKGDLSITLTKESLTVKDSGIGINKKNLKSILERFRRLNSSEGGFGIGLNIVDQVVKNYGFNLIIHSEEKVYTEVIIKWKK